MELTIILLALTTLGILISIKCYNYDFLGVIISFITGFCFICHIFFWSLAGYEYNKFVIKRKAFVETLEYARKNESQFELASITRDILEWNNKLASLKYDNNTFLLKDYIDDRVENLEPIQ